MNGKSDIYYSKWITNQENIEILNRGKNKSMNSIQKIG